MLKILTFSSLYPNEAQPYHGIFVEQRLRHLVASGEVEARVVAPVPWFPSSNELFGRYARYAQVPARETRHGITIDHPRYLVVPKVGMTFAPSLMAQAVEPIIRSIQREFPFDLIDAHYFYPDGIAAATIAQRLGVPFTITARGADINVIPQYPKPRATILEAAGRAGKLIAVCQALKDAMIDLGVAGDRITVLRNGVDLMKFHPVDREPARQRLGFTRRTLLSVGELIPRKGHHIAVAALPALPDVDLVIVGEGEMAAELTRLATQLGVSNRLRLVGGKSHEELVQYYNAADAMVLASDREGMANVLLEALACGCPIIATNVWGTPEVIASPVAGVLMRARTPEALAAACNELFTRYPARADVRRYAEGFDWESTTRGQLEVFGQAR